MYAVRPRADNQRGACPLTRTYEHFVRPADQAELAGAVHMVRALQRQLAAQLANLAGHVADPATRRALEDAAQREEESCAVLIGLLADIDEPTRRTTS